MIRSVRAWLALYVKHVNKHDFVNMYHVRLGTTHDLPQLNPSTGASEAGGLL